MTPQLCYCWPHPCLTVANSYFSSAHSYDKPNNITSPNWIIVLLAPCVKCSRLLYDKFYVINLTPAVRFIGGRYLTNVLNSLTRSCGETALNNAVFCQNIAQQNWIASSLSSYVNVMSLAENQTYDPPPVVLHGLTITLLFNLFYELPLYTSLWKR